MRCLFQLIYLQTSAQGQIPPLKTQIQTQFQLKLIQNKLKVAAVTWKLQKKKGAHPATRYIFSSPQRMYLICWFAFGNIYFFVLKPDLFSTPPLKCLR